MLTTQRVAGSGPFPASRGYPYYGRHGRSRVATPLTNVGGGRRSTLTACHRLLLPATKDTTQDTHPHTSHERIHPHRVNTSHLCHSARATTYWDDMRSTKDQSAPTAVLSLSAPADCGPNLFSSVQAAMLTPLRLCHASFQQNIPASKFSRQPC